MELLESHTHSFVIKIWLEETAAEAGRAVWRGHITHVPSNARRYFDEFDQIERFIVPYLQGTDADVQ